MSSIFKVVKLSITIAVIYLLIMMFNADRAASQDSAAGSAISIAVQTINISSPQTLDFGDILQGVTKSIANNNASAGIFQISGQNQAGINMYLQLPEYLSLSGSGTRLPVIFSTTDASVDTTGAGNPAGMNAGKGWQNTNPRNLPDAAIIGSNGTDIYIGGKVVPSPNQKPGTYTGSIILSVYYSGS